MAWGYPRPLLVIWLFVWLCSATLWHHLVPRGYGGSLHFHPFIWVAKGRTQSVYVVYTFVIDSRV